MSLKSLIVKQVLSGDTLILRDRSKSGPPPEKVVAINNISCPRLARRPTNATETSESNIDEPFAWEAREFTRQLCIGQEVWYQVENKSPGGREYANVFIVNQAGEKENIAELIVNSGFAEVRRQNNQNPASSENFQKIIALEEAAKAAHKGKWATGEIHASIRTIVWTVDNLAKYVESHQNQTVPAIIEHIRDGCTVRAFILPNSQDNDNCYRYVTVMLSGVKTPTFKFGENNEQIPEPFSEEAKFFTESKLLQRKVEIKLETVNNQNIVGTIIHPKGNIAEFILREGFGRIVDWSMGVISTPVASAYRVAERSAKEKRLRLWKDYEPPKGITELPALNGREKPLELNASRTLSGKVIEVGNGDNITIKCSDGQIRKFFLSSIRTPKAPAQSETTPGTNKRFRPLYDIPYLYEAREFLRKKLIAKKVNIRVDYIQPKVDNMEERVMATITFGDMNIAEALVIKGLATVVRYRATDDNRSLMYDALLAAESTAQKKGVGVFSKKEPPTHKVSDLSGDLNKSKQFLASLKRQGKMTGIVEFVASGSRLRVYVPKETCILTILCVGIDCPRPHRRLPNGREEPTEPFGDEAMNFTKELCSQREVDIEIESMDKGGNFIGWVYLEATENAASTSLSMALVENGFAKVHFTAERSSIFKQICDAELKAKETKLNIWTMDGQLTYNEEAVQIMSIGETKIDSDKERVENYKSALVTQISTGTNFYAQLMDNETTIIRITKELQDHFSTTVHVPGSYTPKRGDLCAAKFSIDGCWYRAKILSMEGSRKIRLLFVDFGNEEVNDSSELATLPSNLQKIPFQAVEYSLACLLCVSDTESQELAKHALEMDMLDKEIKLNVEYEIADTKVKAATVKVKCNDKWVDESEALLRDGILYVDDKRKERRLRDILKRYNVTQDEAKNNRCNIWKYGDFRSDDVPF